VSATVGQPDDVTLAVVAARLDDLRNDVRAMRQELATHRAELVPRKEWEQRNQFVDGRFQEHGREIANIRTAVETKTTAMKAEIDARRAPWWTVAAVVLSGAALLVTLTPLIARP
jgi:hypothetical protein